MKRIRLDQLVQSFYPELSRSKVQTLIEKGKVSVFTGEWKVETKSGAKFDSGDISKDQIRLESDEELNYVSRGALKLKKAVEEFEVIISGKVCLDVGLSTGGFTDYLLKNQAEKVLGVDVGRDQIHSSLRDHPKLVYRDKVNAKEPLPEDLLVDFFGENQDQSFDLVVIDVSFISLEKIIPNIISYLGDKGQLICLVKPQFELQKSALNKKGVVKEAGDLVKVQEKIIEVIKSHGLEMIGQCQSPIEGENGNKEFLFLSRSFNNSRSAGV